MTWEEFFTAKEKTNKNDADPANYKLSESVSF
jgi:hypothetical protein